jgi:RHS repeat-associated protein
MDRLDGGVMRGRYGSSGWSSFARGLGSGSTAALVALVLFASPAFGVSLLVNGDFSGGLTGWTGAGEVSASSGISITRDGGVRSVLYQTAQHEGMPVDLSLEFFLEVMSGSVGPGSFPDVAYFSIYEADDPATLRPESDQFETATAVFDGTGAGFSNLGSNVLISPSPRGPGWWVVALTNHVPTKAYLAPTLEVYNFNGVSNDSAAAMTSVRLESVPEPGTMCFVLLGVIASACGLRRRHRGAALIAGMLALSLSLAEAAEPSALGSRVRVVTSDETSALDRVTRVITQTADVSVTNKGDRPLLAPFRLRVRLGGAGDLTRVRLEDVQPGDGADPRPYRDFSSLIPATGLAPGGVVRGKLRIIRPATVVVTYELEAQGVFNRDPVAAFDAPLIGVAGEELSFDASSSSNGGEEGQAISYVWNFGDQAAADTVKVTRVFTKPGRYDVSLTVTDEAGAKAVLRKTVSVFPSADFAVARTRTLDGSGQPLGGVAVRQTAGEVVQDFATDTGTGFISLGGEPGEYDWRFSRPGYLTVWRKASLVARQATFVPSPWLAPLAPADIAVSPLRELTLGEPEGPAVLRFSAGSFTLEGKAGLTVLGPQALPLPLPAGWSPLGAFHLELPAAPSGPVAVTWSPSDALLADDRAAVVRLDAVNRAWTVVSPGIAGTLPAGSVGPGDVFALVVADKGPRAPPAATGGALLPGVPEIAFDSSTVTASGEVDPGKLTASRDAAAMTATGRVVVSAPTELSSGLCLRTEVGESYQLSDGRTQRAPLYDTAFFAYQRPGDADPDTLHAAFPLRPTRLIAPELIDTARVTVQVLTGDSFSASLFDPTGGFIAADGVGISAGPGDLGGRSIAELRLLDPAGFEAVLAGLGGVAFFQFDIGNIAEGKRLGIRLEGLPPGKDFVLARHLVRGDEEGLEPLERLRSGADGVATSVEPDEGLRLPGITGPGQFVVVAVNGRQAVVAGTARNLAGKAVGGLAMRIEGLPWLTFSAEDGSYRLVAPQGAASVVTVTDPADGNSGRKEVSVAAGEGSAFADLGTEATAPRVVRTSPADGAIRVLPSAPVTVRFSEVIDPASFGPAALTLVKAGVPVQGSVSLNRAGTEASFLPTHPLEHGVVHAITLSAGIKDRQGLALEGASTFSFTVAPSAERPPGAELVIYEPGADKIPPAVLAMLVGYNSAEDSSHVVAHGSAGTADPEVPVILVNQNTGETATVLSKLDGSFANFIHASEEDFIEAVFVNANGTRVTVPATRQIHDNGKIGLYKYGGILEAESDGGPVRVIVEPGAIRERNLFKIDPVGMAELLALVNNTQPDGGKLLGGVRIGIEGDALKAPPDLSFPVKEDELDLPPGISTEDGVYALTMKEEGPDGTMVYTQVDKMEYEEGKLETKSPPFPGLAGGAVGQILYLPVRMGFGSKLTVVGKVVAIPDSEPHPSEAQILESKPPISPVPGATVHSGALNGTRLRPGAVVARTNRAGFYALTVPYDFTGGAGVSVRALATRFPGTVAQAGGSLNPGQATPGTVPVLALNPVFRLPSGVGGGDDFAPVIAVRPPDEVLATAVDHEFAFIARDDQSEPSFATIEVDVAASVPINPGETISASDITLTRGARADFGLSHEEKVKILCRKAAIVSVRATARDGSGNERETVFGFRFGPPVESGGDDPAPGIEDDEQAPMVTAALPADDLMLSGNSVLLLFSERIKRSPVEAEGSVTVSPQVPVRTKLSPDGTSLRIEFGDLVPGTSYTATLSESAVKDLSDNRMRNPYTHVFRTPPAAPADMNKSDSAAGSIVIGSFVATILRDNPSNGTLTLHRVADTDNKDPVGSLRLPVFPRAIADIGRYAFKRKPNAATEERRLLAVSGGVVGTDGVGPWLWIVDVTDPAAPARVAGSLVSADPSQVAGILHWRRPHLMLGLSGPEQSFLCHVNPQALILGSNAVPGDGTLVPQYARGVDINGDGDYVDDAEKLPKPEIATLYGNELVLPLSPGRFLTDFDAVPGGSFLVAVLGGVRSKPPCLQVVTANGISVGTGDPESDEGTVPFSRAVPRRVVLDLDFPVTTAAGTRTIPAAVVGVGMGVRVYDLTNPSRPVAVGGPDPRIEIARSGGGQIFSVQRSDSDEYTVVTSSGLFVFSRSAMGNLLRRPTPLEHHPEVSFSGRYAGASPLAFSVTSGNLRIINRPPRISVMRNIGRPVVSADAILALGRDGRSSFLGGGLESSFLFPAIFLGNPAATAPIDPPDPRMHHYVRVRAAGNLGPSMKLAVESLDPGSSLNPAMGDDYPAVLLSGAAAQIGLQPPKQPSVSAVVVKRMSDDPADDLFNEYISSPMLFVREKLSVERLRALRNVTERQAIWSGSFLRFGFDADGGADTDVQPYNATTDRRFKTGLSRTYLTLRPEYIDTPNPSSPLTSPKVAGVDLQSGEFTLPEIDWTLHGRHQDLVLQRVYQSRSRYVGPFGRGWDHCYNARILQIPSDSGVVLPFSVPGGETQAKPGDVLLIDGVGGVSLFRRISEENGNLAERPAYAGDPALERFIRTNGGAAAGIADFYQSPRGVFSILCRLKDGSWMLVGPSGNRTLFRGDGRLDRLIGVFEKSQLVCHYRPDGLLERVEGDRGVSLEFGYYFPMLDLRRSATDLVSDDPLKLAKISRVRSSSSLTFALEVRYDYDDKGRLCSIKPNLGKETNLTYDGEDGDLLKRVGCGDGTDAPAQEIDYDPATGMVRSVNFAGQQISYGGAVATSEERKDAGGGTVSVTIGGTTNEYDLDANGSATGFNGRGFKADPETGIAVRADTPDQKTRLVYDDDNPVHRFRGNLLRTERGDDPGSLSVTETAYDGSAFNRPKTVTDTDGIVTTYDYTEAGAGSLDIRETRGPITRSIRHNAYGQVHSEDLSDAGGGIFSTVFEFGFGGYDRDLVTGNSFTSRSGMKRDVYGRNEIFEGPVFDIRVGYNADGMLKDQAPLGAPGVIPETTYDYDSMMRLSRQSLIGSTSTKVTAYSYGDQRYPGKATTVLENETGYPPCTTDYTFNDSGQVEKIRIGGEETTLDYDGPLNTSMEGPGVKREVTYNPGSSDIKTLVENGVTTTFTHDSGRISSYTTGELTTELEYDAPQAPSTVSERLAKRTLKANGVTLMEEEFGYDDAGRLASVDSQPSGRTREFHYFPDGVLREMKIDGQTLRSAVRDQSGRTLETRLNNVRVRYADFDPAGRARSETVDFPGCPGTTVFTKTYDAVGRLTRSEVGGSVSVYGYDSFGNLVSRVDPDGVAFSQTMSPSGQPLSVKFRDGTVADHSYDEHRRKTLVTSAAGSLTFAYDGDGLVRRIGYPDATDAEFRQRNDFFAPEIVVHGGVGQNHFYDDVGRLERIEVPATGDTLEYGYDPLGRRTSSSFNGNEVVFGYDDGGSPVSETSDAGTWSQTLNSLDHVLSEEYQGGFSVTYAPDTHGQPTAMVEAGITRISWFAAGLPEEIHYAGGLVQSRSYDASLRPVSLRWRSGVAGNAPTLAQFNYQLTPGGRVLSEERTHHAEFDVFGRNAPAEGMRIDNFRFGAKNRNGAEPAASLGDVTFVNGEISAVPLRSNPDLAGPDPRGFFPVITRNGNRLATVDGVPVVHDASGSMTSFPLWVFLPGQSGLTKVSATAAYDGMGLLKRIDREDGVSVVYTRDGLGRIIAREVSGPSGRCEPGVTTYAWRGTQLIEESGEVAAGGNALVRRYVWMGAELVKVQAAARPGEQLVDYIPLTTLNRSVGGYLASDGTVVETIRYGAYGLPVFSGGEGGSVVGGTLLFHGGLFDAATGLYQFGERNLHPLLGQFLQRDSALFSESLAWFTAFDGDPAGRTDPAGTQSEESTSAFGYGKELKAQIDAAKELKEPANKLKEAVAEGSFAGAMGAGSELLLKTIALGQTSADDDIKDKFELASTFTSTLEAFKTGAEVLQSVSEMKGDAQLLRAVEMVTSAEMSGLARAGTLRQLTADGAVAGAADFLTPMRMEHNLGQLYKDTSESKGSLLSPQEFRDEVRGSVAQRRRKSLLSVAGNLNTLGTALAGEYLTGEDHASVVGKQYLTFQGSMIDLATKASEALEGKHIGRFRFTLQSPTRSLSHLKAIGSCANSRSAVSAAWTAGFEFGKLGILWLSDSEVGKAYLEACNQFEENGGWLTVAGGVLTSLDMDRSAMFIQTVKDLDVKAAAKETLQLLIDENRRQAARRETYLRGIGEP